MNPIKYENGRITFDQSERYDDYKLYNGTIKSYEHDALKGNIQKNNVSCIYFSKTNIEALQLGIKNMVLNKTCGKIKIGDQSVDELLIIMRAIYLNKSKNSILDPLKQVKDLNSQVLNYSVPKIIEEAKMHTSYINRITQLPVPLEHGEATSVKGTKTLELRKF